MTRVLFLCSQNACRSQMAKGFARAKAVPGVEVVSAGIEAAQVHPMAVRVMAEVGIDIKGYGSKALDGVMDRPFEVVIVLCAEAAEACPLLPGNPVRVNWNLANPDEVGGDESRVLGEFRRSRDEIHRLVDDFFDRGYLDALAEVEMTAGMILDTISDGIIAHDMHRRIIYFNRAAEAITGYRQADVIGRDCHTVFPGSFCGGKCSFCGGAEPEIDELRQELEIATRTGERRQVQMVVRGIRGKAGKPLGILASFRDLTRQRELERKAGESIQFSGMIGRDPRMLEVFDMIRDVAETNAPVLIMGESGTGKELVAAAIHNESARAQRQFVPVNCGALPETLLESELFGHVKGAFTGAVRDKKGRFELADGGTILLDEIGDVSPAMQVRLMRVLQEGTFERVGSEATIKVDVRVISATNKDLSAEIKAGRFREDLYYRLSVVPIYLPALRERRNDIPLLADYVLGRLLKMGGKEGIRLSPAALDVMVSHDWPGNVRELQNWLQFSLVKCKGDLILPEHLPPARGAAPRVAEANPVLPGRRKLSVESVREALRQTGGNRVEAAKLLGVSRATFYRFLTTAGAA